ncbi:Vitamin B12 transporter BtuB (plasmid) [Sphingobium sp. AntQ-1]|uniref:TonB-dependent receptor n=1 Tax=Sphingobium sp. AntQ-1 TaxID=2930091 RepID=UPI00234E811D|nr:TonB-dependent receptor [Sphingobium sp. AntQ-1]WCP16257.1 Vitamin B12 transporter BtuB [Sphingobium sp. AntQ-1]
MKSYKNLLMSGGMMAGLLVPFQAFGQVATTPAPQAAADTATPADTQQADIIVTAQKRSQSVQKVPATVIVADEKQLTTLGIANVSQLGAITPSARFTTRGQQTLVFLRGIGQAVTQPNADPAVATNINGVYVPSEAVGSALFDTERVEIVTGPQGTLYGRNAVGGVINVVSKQPTDEFSANGFLEYGNYNYIQVLAAVNLPVTDTLAVRAAGYVNRRDGYFTGGGDDQNQSAARLTARWEPTGGTKLTVASTYAHAGGVGGQTQNNPPPYANWRISNADARALGYYVDYDTSLTSVQLDQRLSDNFTFTYLGGYDYFTGTQKTDTFPGPPTSIVTIPQTTKFLSQEARINGQFKGLDLIAGVYYYRQNVTFRVLASSTGNTTIRNNSFQQDGDGYAGFAQATLEVLPDVRLTGGVRYSHDTKDFDGINLTFVNNIQTASVPFGGKVSTNKVNFRAGVDYNITPASLVYGSIATGYNQGGFSTAPITLATAGAAGYDPVDLTAYTFGVKNRFFDNRVTLNVEAFRYDYKNYQVSERVLITGQSQIFNAALARVDGIQVDGILRVLRNGQLSAGLVVLDGVIKQLTTPSGVYDGRRLPFAPKLAINVSYTHDFPLANGNTIRPLANYSHTSSQYTVYNNANGTLINAKDKLDLSLEYVGAADRWSVGLWARNVTDTKSFQTLNAGGIPGPGAGYLDPPRTFGIRFSGKL